MKKKYTVPTIELSTYKMTDILANDNIISDPWGFEDDIDSDSNEETE